MEDYYYTAQKQSRSLMEKTIRALQDPFYDRENNEDLVIETVLKNLNFFHKILEPSIRLQDCIDLTKMYCKYEKHPYGTALLKEKEYADKFYIILKGNVQKLCQRPGIEIEKEHAQKHPKNPHIVKKSFTKPLRPFYETARTLQRAATMNVSSGIHLNNPSIAEVDDDELNEGAKMTRNDKTAGTGYRRGCIKGEGDWPQEVMGFTGSPLNKGFSLQEVNSPVGSPANMLKKFETRTFSHLVEEPKSEEALPDRSLNEEEVTELETQKDTESEQKVLVADKIRGKDHVGFVETIAEMNPDIKSRCLLDEVVRLVKIKSFNAGQYFGENFHRHQQPKESSIIAVSSKEIHLMTISREDFKKVQDELYRRANQKLQLFSELFPFLNEEELNRFSRYFAQRYYKKGEVIYGQNEPVEHLYLLQEGDIRLIKEVESNSQWAGQSPKNSPLTSIKPLSLKKAELPVASVVGGQFFGEELMLEKNRHQYTAISNFPNCIVCSLDIGLFEKLKEKSPHIFKMLKDQAQERSVWRNQRITGLVESKSMVYRPIPTSPNTISSPKSSSKVTSISIPKIGTGQGKAETPKAPITSFKGFTVRPEPPEAKKEVTPLALDDLRRARSLEKVFANGLVSPVQKTNLDVYKAKFARRLPNSSVIIDIKENEFKNGIGSLESFNIRKELKDNNNSRSNRTKLQKLVTGTNTTQKKESDVVKPFSNSQLYAINDNALRIGNLGKTKIKNLMHTTFHQGDTRY